MKCAWVIAGVEFGLGYGNGAHAPNEIFLVESANPTKVAGMDEAALGFVDFLYQVAALG